MQGCYYDLPVQVFEEVGYDITSRVKEEDFIESVSREHRVKLYIVSGVPEDTIFETHTRKEISVRGTSEYFSKT